MTCSPILTYFEIVDTLVDVSKTWSYHYDLIPDTAIIPIGGNYSVDSIEFVREGFNYSWDDTINKYVDYYYNLKIISNDTGAVVSGAWSS
jgi:hypothetical protein